MVAAMRGTLSGDARALQQHFKVSVEGSPAQWLLQLVPLDHRLLGVVRRVRIEGQRSEVRSVEVALADGDRSVMSIEPVAAAAASSAAPATDTASKPRSGAP